MAKKKNKKDSVPKLMSGEIEENVIHISGDDYRHYLQGAYACGGGYADCKGRVIQIAKDKGYLFKTLYVGFMEHDGSYTDGKEDHVWVYDAEPFKKANIGLGDCVSFTGQVYPYKRRDGSRDYGLKECFDIKKIESYSLPDDEKLRKQGAERIVCDTICMYSEQCAGLCIAPDGWKEEMIKTLLHSDDNGAT